MRIVIAPDSFKECASSAQVAQAIATGLARVFPDAELVQVPLADGGEGTARVLVEATGGTLVARDVTGPLGDPVRAAYGILGDGQTAVIEMAEASGIHLVPAGRRDPRLTTTRGTGELMRDALDRGIRKMIIGIGGSATNDAGAGMAQALGFRLLDQQGSELPPGGAALAHLARIDPSGAHPALNECEIWIACDVANPLSGPLGASRVYGPQKGATPEVVEELDAALRRFGETVERQFDIPILGLVGGGAAGGLGAGLVAFTRGRMRPGFEIVADAVGLDQKIAGASLVFTGEGAMDSQTSQGKVPAGVARLARSWGVPIIALAGTLGEGYRALYEHGIDAAFSICSGPLTLAEAVAQAETLLANAAEAVGRVWKASRLG